MFISGLSASRGWLLVAIFFLFLWVEYSAGEQKTPDAENGRPVVRCVVRGRITGIEYVNYICQRAGGGWVPVP